MSVASAWAILVTLGLATTVKNRAPFRPLMAAGGQHRGETAVAVRGRRLPAAAYHGEDLL